MIKQFFSRLLILLLIIQIAVGVFVIQTKSAKAAGTIYYVDNIITDTHTASATPDCTNYNTTTYTCSGGSASAFATIADINAFSTLQPGDSVLFRKGQTWREQLTVPSSGSSGNPITFGAYGSGDKPIISGSSLASSGWTYDAVGYVIDGTNAISVSTDYANAGTHSMEIYFAGTGTKTYAQTTFSNQTDLYAQISFYLPAGTTNAAAYNSFPTLLIYSGSTQVAWAGFGSKADASKFNILSYLNGSVLYSGTANEVSTGAWHILKIHWVKGTGADGGMQVWLDGTSKASNFTKDETSYNINDIEVGQDCSGYGSGSELTTGKAIYIDSVKVGTTDGGTNIFTSDLETETNNFNVEFGQGIGVANVWNHAVTAAPPDVYFNGVKGTLQASKAACTSAGYWYATASVLSVYSTSDPAAAYTNPGIEYPTIANGIIVISSKDYITLNGLRITGGTGSTPNGMINVSSSNYATIQNCTVDTSSSIVYGTALDQSTHATVTNNVFHDTLNTALYFRRDSTYPTVSYNEIYNIGLIDQNGDNAAMMFGGGSAGWQGIDNALVEHNYIHDIGVSCPGAGHSHSQTVVFDRSDNSIFRYNYISNSNKGGVSLGGDGLSDILDGAQIYYNIFVKTPNGVLHTNPGSAAAIGFHDAKNVKVYNNVIYNAITPASGNKWGDAPFYAYYTALGATMSGNIIKNNIVHTVTGAYRRQIAIGADTGVTINNNDYYDAAGLVMVYGANTYYSLSTWTAGTTFDTNSISSDPLFVSTVTPDFHLQSTSPAINVGTNVSLTSDYAGVSVPRGAGYEIGAYEYPVPLAPTIGSPSALSFSSIRWNFTDNSNDETGFRLYGSPGAVLVQSPLTNLSYLDETGLSAGTQYSGRYVKAYNSYGESVASDVAISMTTPGVPGGGSLGLMGTSPATTNLSLPAAPTQTAPPTAPSPAPSSQPSIPTTPITTPIFTQTLKYGFNNKQIILLQDTLKQLGFFPQSIKSNGSFGPTTRQSVKRFQCQYNIVCSGNERTTGYGQVGPKTRQALNQLNH